ncbi:hypothetical protein ACFSTI_13380 [Rhizorhabdus histidinilytica]
MAHQGQDRRVGPRFPAIAGEAGQDESRHKTVNEREDRKRHVSPHRDAATQQSCASESVNSLGRTGLTLCRPVRRTVVRTGYCAAGKTVTKSGFFKAICYKVFPGCSM